MWIRKRQSDQDTDRDLLLRFQKSGDQEALAILFDRYLELIYGVCMKYLKETELARDATLGVYEQLNRKLADHEIDQFKSWLYVLVKNHCLGLLRKETTRQKHLNGAGVMHSDNVVHLNGDEQQDWIEENRERLGECLVNLPEKQRMAIRLFYYEAHSYEEIAEIMQAPANRVRSYMQNGRRNLKLCLERKHGISKI